jgi:hypothetical protein
MTPRESDPTPGSLEKATSRTLGEYRESSPLYPHPLWVSEKTSSRQLGK